MEGGAETPLTALIALDPKSLNVLALLVAEKLPQDPL